MPHPFRESERGEGGFVEVGAFSAGPAPSSCHCCRCWFSGDISGQSEVIARQAVAADKRGSESGSGSARMVYPVSWILSECVCVCVAVWLPGDTGVVVSLAWQAAYVRHFVVAATRRMRNAK